MPWVRSGTCCRCGECCQDGDPFPGDTSTLEENPRRSYKMRMPPEKEGWCPLLRSHIGDPAGDFSCIGHPGSVPLENADPYYMSGCNVWPDHPDQIADKPSCTYTFTWVADGDEESISS